MTCPRCGQPTPPDAHFCTACGAKLGAATCHACGHELPADAHFCVECGAPIEAETGAAAPTPPLPTEAPTPAAPSAPAAPPPGLAPTPTPAPAPSTASATRYVPARGMSAWAAPDPSTAAIARLAGGTPLEVMEQRGAWAHVRAGNGWTGWVDARNLTDTSAPAAAGASATTAPTAMPWMQYLGIAGGVLAVLGALLPWIDAFGTSRNAFDVPVPFLFDYQTTAGTGFNVGTVVIILGVAVAAAAFVPVAWANLAARSVAGVLAFIGVVYLFQLSRLASDVDISLTDVMGYGPVLTIIGGIAAAFQRPMSGRSAGSA